jgi:hypothetical protein
MLLAFVIFSALALLLLFAASRAASATGSSADMRMGDTVLCIAGAALCALVAFVLLIVAAFS